MPTTTLQERAERMLDRLPPTERDRIWRGVLWEAAHAEPLVAQERVRPYISEIPCHHSLVPVDAVSRLALR